MRKRVGWRQPWQTRCPETWDFPVMVTAGAPYPRPMGTKRVRCERPAGHPDWHSCDEASWAPNLPKSPWVSKP